jgi:hypothetical protein
VRFIFRRYAELGSVRLLKDELQARSIHSKLRTSASGRISGGKPYARGALYLMLQNHIYLGQIVHNHQSYAGGHEQIVDQPLWDAVQAKLAGNAAEHSDCGKTQQPSLLAGMLFDRDGNRMTPSHAGKKGTRYRYYVSGSLMTKDRTENSAALRIPAAEIEELVSDRVHRWLLDPGSIYKSTTARLADPSIQHRRAEQAAEIGKHWPELSVARRAAAKCRFLNGSAASAVCPDRSSRVTKSRSSTNVMRRFRLGVRCCHSLEFGQDWHFLKVLGAEARPVDAGRCSAGALDADRVGWRRDHAEWLIGRVAGHRGDVPTCSNGSVNLACPAGLRWLTEMGNRVE